MAARLSGACRATTRKAALPLATWLQAPALRPPATQVQAQPLHPHPRQPQNCGCGMRVLSPPAEVGVLRPPLALLLPAPRAELGVSLAPTGVVAPPAPGVEVSWSRKGLIHTSDAFWLASAALAALWSGTQGCPKGEWREGG